MVLLVHKRNFSAFTWRKGRWVLLSLQQSQFKPVGAYVTERFVTVRNHILSRTGSRKNTLRVGILVAKVSANKNVVLYRKLQPYPQQFYPVFTPWKRRVKALGVEVAPVIPVGSTGSGIDIQHYLGLSLLKLGGMRF